MFGFITSAILLLCCLFGFCVLVFYKRKHRDRDNRTPYEKWMEQYENKSKNNSTHNPIVNSTMNTPNNSTQNTPVNSTHNPLVISTQNTPVNSTHGYAYSTNPLYKSNYPPPPPPPPTHNSLPLPPGRIPLRRSSSQSSMRRSSGQRRSSTGYGEYDMYGSDERVISSNNPLYD